MNWKFLANVCIAIVFLGGVIFIATRRYSGAIAEIKARSELEREFTETNLRHSSTAQDELEGQIQAAIAEIMTLRGEVARLKVVVSEVAGKERDGTASECLRNMLSCADRGDPSAEGQARALIRVEMKKGPADVDGLMKVAEQAAGQVKIGDRERMAMVLYFGEFLRGADFLEKATNYRFQRQRTKVVDELEVAGRFIEIVKGQGEPVTPLGGKGQVVRVVRSIKDKRRYFFLDSGRHPSAFLSTALATEDLLVRGVTGALELVKSLCRE